MLDLWNPAAGNRYQCVRLSNPWGMAERDAETHCNFIPVAITYVVG